MLDATLSTSIPEPTVGVGAVTLALGRWIRERGEDTDGLVLRAMVPVSVRAQTEDESYGYDEMIRLSVGLLFAGHETTVNRIGLGALLLLSRRERWEDLSADPTRGPTPTSRRSCGSGRPGTSACCATRTPTSRSAG